MDEIINWCKNKPYIIALLAPQIAASATACFEFLNKWKSGIKLTEADIPPNPTQWLDLYRSNKQVEKHVKKIFTEFGEIAETGIELFEMFNLSRKERRRLGSTKFNSIIKKELMKLTPEEFKEIQDAWSELIKISLEDIENDIITEADDGTIQQVKKHFNEPEIQFYFRVFLPCWLIYGQHPGLLLRKARLGDIDAIDQLLRLDPTLIDDSKIMRTFQVAIWSGKKTIASKISDALTKPPKMRINNKSIKAHFAGMISAISHLIGAKIQEPDIRKLFDAIAQKNGLGEIDTDLPDSPEAFSKAIQRERKFWLAAIKYPDKK